MVVKVLFRARMRTLLTVLAAAPTGCGDVEKSSLTSPGSTDGGEATDTGQPTSDQATSTGDGACAGDPPTLAFTNDTPWTFSDVRFSPCDAPTLLQTHSFPNGLEPGGSAEVPLPEPGCYLLRLDEPSGCFADPPLETGELAACEALPLVLIEEQFACPGGAGPSACGAQG